MIEKTVRLRRMLPKYMGLHCAESTVCRTRSSYSSGLGVASLLPPSTVNMTVARHRCAVAARADPMDMDPPVVGLFGFKFSSRPHPWKFRVKRFLVLREVLGGSGVACFGLPPLAKIIGRVAARGAGAAAGDAGDAVSYHQLSPILSEVGY